MGIYDSNLSSELEALQKKIISLEVERGVLQESAKRLNETKQILEVTLNGISDAVFLMDKDFRILWSNRHVLDLYGYKMDEIVGQFCYKVTHNRNKKCAPPNDICPVDRIIKTGFPVILKHKHFNKAGEEQIVEVTASPIKDDAGQVTHYVHITRDITAQSLKESNLSAEEEKYHSLFNELNLSVLVGDTRTHVILWVNTKAIEMFGYGSFGHLVGNTIEEALAGEDLYLQKKLQLAINKAVTNKAAAFDWFLRGKDGREVPIEVDLRIAVIGGVQLLLAVVRNTEEFMSEKVRLEEDNSPGS